MTARITSVVRDLGQASAPLTAVGLLMLAALVPFAAGVWLDPGIVGGAPAWLKPAKFAASFAIYSLTLAWLFRYLGAWRQTKRVAGWTSAVVFAVEMAVIAMQAWRGTTSHFNVGTPFDAAVFGVMGAAIFLQTAAVLAVAVALWRERFADPALGWALRLGMALTIVGASTGGLMVRPTEAQLANARAGGGMPIAGAHTVGAPDGGPGLPGTGWSVEHGDLRVPHFIGLHAVQALGLFAWVVGMRWTQWTMSRRVRLVVSTSASYAALFAILLWQALRGDSIVQPDAAVLVVLAAWTMATTAALYAAVRADSFGRPALVQ
jgi:hypothetical protein